MKESYDAMLNEKKEYDTQLELLNETIKEYETLNANKVELLVHKCMNRFYQRWADSKSIL